MFFAHQLKLLQNENINLKSRVLPLDRDYQVDVIHGAKLDYVCLSEDNSSNLVGGSTEFQKQLYQITKITSLQWIAHWKMKNSPKLRCYQFIKHSFKMILRFKQLHHLYGDVCCTLILRKIIVLLFPKRK